MTSIRPLRFAERVLSSTRISENSQLDVDHSQNDQEGRLLKSKHSRRRLRILDEEEQELISEIPVNDENTDPSFLFNPLPSSIAAPVSSSRLFSDDDDNDGEPTVQQRRKGEGRNKTVFSEEESDEDEEMAPLTARLHNTYDPRISVSERDRLADRSPSVTSVNSEPEEDVAQPSDRPEDVPPADDVDAQTLDRLRRLAKGASKRTVKKPRPKLDPERLLSDRGLPALLNECKRVKFKGRGYEFQDLDRLLFKYEAWANRVLPKCTFTEIIERLERVGSRREIQVALHRLRNGIWPPYVSAEHVHTSDSEDDDHPVGSGGLVERTDATMDDEAAWERALQAIPVQRTADEHSLPQYRSPGSSAPSDSFSELEDTYPQLPPLRHSPPPAALSSINISSKSPEPIPSPSTTVDASFESRADRNRRLALERLEARRRLEQSQTSSPLFASGPKSLLKSALRASLQNPAPSILPSTFIEGNLMDSDDQTNANKQCQDSLQQPSD